MTYIVLKAPLNSNQPTSSKANVAKLLIDEGYTFHPLIFWSYWTEVHQMFIRCSQIIADKHLKSFK